MNNLSYATAQEFIDQGQFIAARDLLIKLVDAYPDDFRILSSLSWTYFKTGDTYRAILLIEDVLARFPSYGQAYSNYAGIHFEQNKLQLSLQYIEKALEINPTDSSFLLNRSIVLEKLGRHKDAHDSLISCDSSLDRYRYIQLHSHSKVCDWLSMDAIKLESPINSPCSINPWMLYSLFDDSSLHLKCAVKYQENFTVVQDAYNYHSYSSSQKINIGYFSADLRDHPMMDSLRDVILSHDQDKFNVYVFSLSKIFCNDVTQKIAAGVTRLIDISHFNIGQKIDYVRGFDLSAAFDLMGYTDGHQIELFKNRIAPVQISMIGNAGTTGLNAMDYIVCDKYVLPPEDTIYFAEKPLYMNRCFLPCNKYKAIPFGRQKSFSKVRNRVLVFACFNNSYKFSPEIFECWCQLLSSVPNSKLWLLDPGETARANITEWSKSRLNDCSRIIFLPRVEKKYHLCRYKIVDIYLDTFCYSAHVTATDCLYFNVPLVALKGDSFASRVAASLLSFSGFTELVASTIDEYYSIAYKLATDEQYRDILKFNFQSSELKKEIYNPLSYTKELELKLQQVICCSN